MKVFVWDDGFLGSGDGGNIVRELHAVFQGHVEVKMLDGQIWAYHNAMSIDKMYCRKGHKIKEDWIGKNSEHVSDGYVCACHICEEDMYLFEVIHNEPEAKDVG